MFRALCLTAVLAFAVCLAYCYVEGRAGTAAVKVRGVNVYQKDRYGNVHWFSPQDQAKAESQAKVDDFLASFRQASRGR